MIFKIYYTEPVSDMPYAHNVETLSEALRQTESYRKMGRTFVTMVAHDPNQVGKAGVDAVVDGRTPDGEVYDWNKSARIGKPKRSDTVIESTDN